MKKLLRASAPALMVLLIIIPAVMFCGCRPKNVTIEIAGSTSVQPLVEELAAVFMKEHPGVRMTYAATGSGAGIKAAREGTHDIGASSRELKPDEKTVKEFKIAVDAIAVIVHPSNSVSGLTSEQLARVFSGEISNWRELGGRDAPITVITREEGSGTRTSFEEFVMRGAPIKQDAVVQTTTGAVLTAVASDANSIGYVSLGSLNTAVKAVSVDGVMPSQETVKSGTYRIQRPFLLLTRSEPAGEVKEFIDFVLGDAGQDIVKQKGFIPIK